MDERFRRRQRRASRGSALERERYYADLLRQGRSRLSLMAEEINAAQLLPGWVADFEYPGYVALRWAGEGSKESGAGVEVAATPWWDGAAGIPVQVTTYAGVILDANTEIPFPPIAGEPITALARRYAAAMSDALYDATNGEIWDALDKDATGVFIGDTGQHSENFVMSLAGSLGLGFHPDTRFSQYVDQAGQRMFGPVTAAAAQRVLYETHYSVDPYQVGLEAWRDLGLL